MLKWETPKTNWNASLDENGNYIGDRFNASDYNRIKNNLEFLRQMASQTYQEFKIQNVSNDKTPSDYFYADEINKIEQNLKTININTINIQFDEPKLYHDNQATMTYEDLNRLESLTERIYNILKNQINNRRMFKWNFGNKGGIE